MDIASMTIGQAREEARRRDERRAKGLPLHATPEEESRAEVVRIAEEDARREKEIQREVRKLFIAFGCDVYNLSQARASKQSAGLGDLVVFHSRTNSAWWFETKTPRGVVSGAQSDFAKLCALCGWEYIVGGVRAAEEQLVKIGAAYRDTSGALEPQITGTLRGAAV